MNWSSMKGSETDPPDRRAPDVGRWVVPGIVAATFVAGFLAFFALVLPGYKRTTTSTYGGKFGYPAMLRRFGLPLPIETTVAEKRRITRSLLAEGTLASDPVQLPMVPMARVVGVYVQPGQIVHKGDLLAELEDRKGKLTEETARLELDIAKAELMRVRVGSPLEQNREQDERDKISVSSLKTQVGLLRDEVAMKDKLYHENLISMDRYLESKQHLEEAERSLSTAYVSLAISSAGKSVSEQKASKAVEQAVLQWKEALQELEDFKIVAPADGVVDRVLIHAGEFNQLPGTPAFVLAVGLWFEAYFDQTALGDIVKDQTVDVHLAARPGDTFTGRVANVDPIVSYTTGGPETGTPVRPIGTGGPEWPATFQVRIAIAPEMMAGLAPGLTGFAHLVVVHDAVAVPAG